MSRFFGSAVQNGYLVRDLQAAVRHWTQVIGVGPFYLLEHASFPLVYRGEPSVAQVSVAMANSGPLQIELIRLESEGPSLYRDFLTAGHEGLHHLAYVVPSIEHATERSGRTIVQSGEGGGVRFVYLDTETHPGTVVELIEESAGVTRMFEGIQAASREWDGSDPVRPFASLYD